MKIGLFGGSFNPIHNAHITLAHTICEQACLDEVWFLVSPHNPLKKSATLLDEDARLELTKLALADYPQLIASDYEFHLERPSYTWKTLCQLTKDFPGHQFCLIIGGDNWDVFDKWANHNEILENFQIIIYPREGSTIDETSLPHSVTLVQTPKINITSTMLRDMIANGKDISPYVPKAVAEKIKEESYYK